MSIEQTFDRIASALERIADNQGSRMSATAKTEPVESTPVPPTSAPVPQPPVPQPSTPQPPMPQSSVPSVTKDQLWTQMSDVYTALRAKGNGAENQIGEMLKEYNAEYLDLLDPQHYAAVSQRLTEMV